MNRPNTIKVTNTSISIDGCRPIPFPKVVLSRPGEYRAFIESAVASAVIKMNKQRQSHV